MKQDQHALNSRMEETVVLINVTNYSSIRSHSITIQG